MLTKDEIRDKICRRNPEADLPLGPFVEWVETRMNQEVLKRLKEVQAEVVADEKEWRGAAAYGNVQADLERTQRWKRHCEQACAYYTAITHRPRNKSVLNFLLRGR